MTNPTEGPHPDRTGGADASDDPVAEASRPGGGTRDEEQVPTGGPGAGALTPGTSTEEGLSTVPLSAEDLDPDDDLLAGAPLDDDPGSDSSMA